MKNAGKTIPFKFIHKNSNVTSITVCSLNDSTEMCINLEDNKKGGDLPPKKIKLNFPPVNNDLAVSSISENSLTSAQSGSSCASNRIRKRIKLKGKSVKLNNKTQIYNDSQPTDSALSFEPQIPEGSLESQNEHLCTRLHELKSQVDTLSQLESYQNERLTYQKLKKNKEMLYYYVGSKDTGVLESMAEKISQNSDSSKVESELLVEDQLILSLMKIRRNYPMHDLAFRFRITLEQAEKVIFQIILMLHHIYYTESTLNTFVKSEDLSELKGAVYNPLILECVKISLEIMPNPSLRTEAIPFSTALSMSSMKGFLAISPNKDILAATSLFKESIDNTTILKDWEYFKRLKLGDVVLADKNLSIDECIPPDVKFNCPSSFNTKSNLTIDYKTRALIARTTLQHIRKFLILNKVPFVFKSIVSEIFQLCASLANLSSFIK